ncbi:MAG: thiamine pyrophosphate-dependent enzyme [Steroidobacterales bacterium]
MTPMTGGDAIAESLLRHGVDTLFGLPGAQIYGLFDAFARREGALRVITPRHEQTCAYMALGYSQASGRPGVYAVVPGPGMLNTSAALLTAYGLNAPVLCLTGQVPSAFLGRGRGHLHEMPDQLATLRTLTRHAARIEQPGDAPRIVDAAFRAMLSGRPGPAAIEAPWDYFGATGAVDFPAVEPLAAPPEPDTKSVEQAARILKEARAPLIVVGGGARHAGAEVLELAELLGAPVMSFRSGRGIVSDEHELGVTIASGYKLWPHTDVVIGIGTRLEVTSWRWKWTPAGLKNIRIEIDRTEMERVPVDAGILADAAAGARELATTIRRLGIQLPDRRADIRAAKAAAAVEIEKIQPQMAYLRAIRSVLPRDGIFVDEVSQAGFTSWFGFPIYRPRTFIGSGYQGTLGSGFPMALGVKVAQPDRAVVSIAGDGGFQFGLQDLATAVQYGIGVVIVLFNNNSYGNVRRDQNACFEGRTLGADLVNPDFLKLAEAYGVRASRASSPDALRVALDKAFAESGPTLIEAPIEKGVEKSPWRFIEPRPA